MYVYYKRHGFRTNGHRSALRATVLLNTSLCAVCHLFNETSRKSAGAESLSIRAVIKERAFTSISVVTSVKGAKCKMKAFFSRCSSPSGLSALRHSQPDNKSGQTFNERMSERVNVWRVSK